MAAREYIFGKMNTVRGYIDPGDALMIGDIMGYQTRNGLSGGAAEIGVFYGRSYFLMRQMLAAGENAFAADLFDIGAARAGERDQYGTFLESAAELGLGIDEGLVFRGDSKGLTAEDITSKVGKVRFFSVDGGHMLDDVVHDAALARDALAEHGVIAFDDSFNFEWPEVTLGLFRFLEENENILPFAITQKKTYVCKASHHARYLAAVEGSKDLSGLTLRPGTFLGTKVVFVHHKLAKRVAHAALSRVGAPRLAGGLY
jgi:SAM-dependent methyltransferase